MAKIIRSPGFIRFGLFEVDLKNSELRKRGLKIKLQQQPFEVLVALLERPGEIVTLDELRQRIWPEDIFVDFEHNLRTAILKIRTALGDHTANPSFIETIPRHGYRFIAPVQAVSENQATTKRGPSVRRRLRWAVRLATVTAFVVATVLYFVPEKQTSGEPADGHATDQFTGWRAHAFFLTGRQSGCLHLL